MTSRTTKKLLLSDELILDGKSLKFFSTERTGGTSVVVVEETPSVVTTNLVVHLDAGDTDSYPLSGTTWSDLTTTNADASLQNGASFNSGYDGSIVFDGTNDYAQIPSSSWSVGNIFNGSNNFTISLWVNINSFPTNTNYTYSPVLFAPAEGHAYITLGDGIPTNELGLRVYLNNAWTTPVSSNTLSKNTWYNICVTYDSSSGFVFYQNGSSVDTNSTTGTIGSQSSSYTLIGGSTAASQYRYLNGSIASLLVYDRAITAAEATQNYNAIKSRYEDNSTITTTNLVYHVDAANSSSYSGSGTTWSDLSTNSNNTTLTGPTFGSFNGGYFDFDGSNDHAISASDMFSPNANFTFSSWVNADATITGTIISDYYSIGALQIRFVSDGTVQVVDSYQVNVGTFSNFTYSTGTWYNVVVTRSSNTYSLYINGVFKSSFTSSNVYSYGPQAIGTNYNGVERFNGQIAQIACYNVALSSTQIEENFDALKNRYGYKDNLSIITQGLLLHLDAANSSSYSGSGSTWTDLSDEGNNGTIYGATYSSSEDGYFDFDGTNDYVDFGNVLNQYPITISAWTKVSSTADAANIVNKYTSGSGNGYRLSFSTNGVGGYYFKDSSNRTNNFDTEYGTVTAGRWYNVVMTVDSSGIKFYLNGSQVGSNTWSGTAGAPTTTTTLKMGLYPYSSGGGNYYDGQISQLAIYNTALTSSEVLQNYDALRQRYGI